MPTDTVEAAQAWRRKNLNIARRKDVKPAPSGLAALASSLQGVAQKYLDGGKDIADLVPALRSSLSAVPFAERDHVDMREPVMRVLLAHLLDQMPPRDTNPVMSCGAPVYVDDMTEYEAREAGEFWYQVAAGELVFVGVNL
jgi:hypothetical protein